MLPIRLLALLGFMNLSLLRKLFPNFVFEKSFFLENFYDIDVYQPYYSEILTKASLSVFLCSRFMDIRAGDLSLSRQLKSKLIRSMMQRIIFSRRFDRSLDFCSRILRAIHCFSRIIPDYGSLFEFLSDLSNPKRFFRF